MLSFEDMKSRRALLEQEKLATEKVYMKVANTPRQETCNEFCV